MGCLNYKAPNAAWLSSKEIAGGFYGVSYGTSESSRKVLSSS